MGDSALFEGTDREYVQLTYGSQLEDVPVR